MATMICRMNGPRDPKSPFSQQGTAVYLARIFKGEYQRVAGFDEHGNKVTLAPEDRAAGRDYHALEFAIVGTKLVSKQDAIGWLERSPNVDPNALKGFEIVSVQA